MPFSSLLKGSAPKGRGKEKPRKGSLGVSPIIAPHSTPFEPPGRSSTLPRSMPSSSAVDTKPSIASLVRTSLGIDLGGLSVSPKAPHSTPFAPPGRSSTLPRSMPSGHRRPLLHPHACAYLPKVGSNSSNATEGIFFKTEGIFVNKVSARAARAALNLLINYF